MVVGIAILEKAVKFEPRQSEQLAGLIMRQRHRAVAFDGQSFERHSAGIGVLGDVVGQLDSDLVNRAARVKKAAIFADS